MGSKKTLSDEQEESYLKATLAPGDLIVGMVLKTAIELDLFEIMAKAGPNAEFSASQISSFLPTNNPEAPLILDRILRLLAGYSYLNCKLITDESGDFVNRLYSLAPVSQAFIRNDDGVSASPLFALRLDRVFLEPWFHLKDTILEGGMAFERAHGMNSFEYQGIDSRFNEVFNKGMNNDSSIVMKKIVEIYNGFDGVKEMIDVGGGLGASLACIVSKYPNIKGINFDLPHVIKDAPIYPGVEHVAGDMFESVPKGDTIFMKRVLHDWSDGHCLKLLKNCWNVLPKTGKVIIIDEVLSENPDGGDVISRIGLITDIRMMVVNPGGKERTLKEFEALAKAAGFLTLKHVCSVYHYWIIELYKN